MFPAPTPITIPVHGGGDPFPVRRVFCVGRNYAAHAIEMGSDPEREAPFFFTKPADAIVPSGSTIAYPSRTADFQHEIELVVAIGKQGSAIPVEAATGYVFGYAVGLDMTRRDLQMDARKTGRPWDMGKAFDQSAPCGAITPIAVSGPITAGKIAVTVNGEPRQSSDVSLLIWSVAEVIADLSHYVELMPGDVIYTGTPEGVGPVQRGETMVGKIDGLQDLTIAVAAA